MIFKLTDIVPSSLLAVTVYCVRLTISVGMPLSCPVEVLKLRPGDNCGDMLHCVTNPPVDIGDRSKTVELLSKLTSLGT